MKERLKFTLSALIWAVVLLAAYVLTAHAQTTATDDRQASAKKGNVTQATGANLPVLGNGTAGQLTKWTGFSSSNSFTGNSIITADKLGQIGIGTMTPTSKLTVQGMIETTLGGYKFPDGSLQTTAFDPTQFVRSLNGLRGDLNLAGGTNITVTPAGNPLALASTSSDPELNSFQDIAFLFVNPEQFITVGGIVVPPGKRLVIEHLTVYSVINDEFQPIEITTTGAGVQATHSIPAPEVGRRAYDREVLIYADSNVHFRVITINAKTVDNASFDIAVTGHLVDLP